MGNGLLCSFIAAIDDIVLYRCLRGLGGTRGREDVDDMAEATQVAQGCTWLQSQPLYFYLLYVPGLEEGQKHFQTRVLFDLMTFAGWSF